MKYQINESTKNDRDIIDFSITDEEENVLATVYGESTDLLSIECSHGDVDFTDEDEMGVCAICGAQCYWHRENSVVDEGHDDNGDYYAQVSPVPVIDEWDTEYQGGSDCVINNYLENAKRPLTL